MERLEDIILQKEPLTRSRFLMEKVGRKMGWEKDIVRHIVDPQHIIILRLPVKSWGKVLNLWGCLVLHNNSRGPYKGGVRISPHVDIWETAELARLMSLKTAVTEIEFGGGKAGIRLDMKEVYKFLGKGERDREFEKVIRLDICEEFAYQIRRYLEDHTYIPAPDLGSGPEEMAFIYNQTQDPATVTGKPEGIAGWLPGRKESTGYGCAHTTKVFMDGVLHLQAGKAKLGLQGFGKVGSCLALYLYEMGTRIVAITDAYGGVYDKEGIDIPALFDYTKKKGTVKDFSKETITNAQLFSLDVDVLIPAATSHVIDINNASKIKAGCIVEAANAPITEEGMEILNERKISVIPDIIANSGGVIASMEEYSRSLSAIKIDKEEVFKIIRKKVDESLKLTLEISQKENIPYSEAAIQIAMSRIYDVMRKRYHI
ncbi:MAG: Glutamate dehydrogenase [candidate division WS2 bacterium]|nr:Glutamate dehydrogenase [Candidatus Psychracetigena formicireducens]